MNSSASVPRPQSAAMPSPFRRSPTTRSSRLPHTGARVAPDGAIDWRSLPSFDAKRVRGHYLVPQAFSHLAVIEAAARIIVPETLGQY